MATSSILEKITINNPKFIEMYVDHMDASTGMSGLKRLSDAEIEIADKAESRRLSELRRKKRLASECAMKSKIS
jgi:hypothetical protein